MNKDKDQTTRDSSPPDCHDRTEAEIDTALEGSFPASDPPPWTLGTVSCDDNKKEESAAPNGDSRLPDETSTTKKAPH